MAAWPVMYVTGGATLEDSGCVQSDSCALSTRLLLPLRAQCAHQEHLPRADVLTTRHELKTEARNAHLSVPRKNFLLPLVAAAATASLWRSRFRIGKQ
jgi:hypothetical protein